MERACVICSLTTRRSRRWRRRRVRRRIRRKERWGEKKLPNEPNSFATIGRADRYATNCTAASHHAPARLRQSVIDVGRGCFPKLPKTSRFGEKQGQNVARLASSSSPRPTY